MSRAFQRQAAGFREAEERGAAAARGATSCAERLELVRERRARGTALPGRLAHLQGDGGRELGARLELRLAARKEAALEQLRFCLEELEVGLRNMEATPKQSLEEEELCYANGQEYWRKRQLLEAVLATDPPQVFTQLEIKWERPSNP
jgi:hypothetical protein